MHKHKYFNNDFSKEIWIRKHKHYADKSIEDTWKRLAKSSASVEKAKEHYANAFYKLLKDFKFVPGGRIIANLGTGIKGTTILNCFSGGFQKEDKDSLIGIMESVKKASIVLKSEGGHGENFSVLRPRGAYIHGINNESCGAVEFIDLWNVASSIITKGSGSTNKNKKSKSDVRKGAIMGILEVWHPDIEEFITVKQQPNKLTRFNLSVGITEGFMEAVKKHKSWKLMFPDIEKVSFKVYAKEWDGKIERWIAKGLPIKVYKEFKDANELWDIIMKSCYNRNEPGVLFLDRINELNNLKYCEDIRHTNACVTGDTPIYTTHGIFTIKELSEKYASLENLGVYSYDRNTNKIVIKKGISPRKTRYNQDIYKITFEDGSYIKSTKDHHYLTADGKEIECKDLKIGDSLLSCYAFNKGIEKAIICFKKISNIEYIGKEDVYNITVEDTHVINYILQKDGKPIGDMLFTKNCAELPLPENGFCMLGSINHTQYLKSDLSDYDFKKLASDIPLMVRFMDNLLEMTNAPLEVHVEEALKKRRIGIGHLGYASALSLLKLRYGSKEALAKTEEFLSFMANEVYKASALLAKEKGHFPLYTKDYLDSKFIKNALKKDTIMLIEKYGIRNSHSLMTAPTGNTSILANVVSGGLEPIFSPEYKRTHIIEKLPKELLKELPKNVAERPNYIINNWSLTKEGDVDVYVKSINGNVYKYDKDRGITQETIVKDYAKRFLDDKGLYEEYKKYFPAISDLTLEDHINTMKLFAKYTDNSISKTINLPNAINFEDFKDVYMKVYDSGYIKGCTTYRMGTMTEVLSDIKAKNNSIKFHDFWKEHKDGVVKKTVKLPSKYSMDGFIIKSEGKKWYIHVAFKDVTKKRPFALFVQTNNRETNIDTHNAIYELNRLAKRMKIPESTILDNMNKFSKQSNVDKIARTIGLLLRHNVPLVEIINSLDSLKDVPITSFIVRIKKFLSQFIDDGTILKEHKCPSCNGNIIFREGCLMCMNCGYSKC